MFVLFAALAWSTAGVLQRALSVGTPTGVSSTQVRPGRKDTGWPSLPV